MIGSACTAAPLDPSLTGMVSGQVIGLDGELVRDAEVAAGESRARTDESGRFEIPVDDRGSWVTVEHPAYLSRTRAGIPGDPLLIRLTPDDGATVALHFGGDVMTGRRFFDRDEDGDRDDALIDDFADVDAHRELLEPISPLLANADLTTVNVESPISEEPYLDPTRPRGDGVHPTKDFVFASGTALPDALAAAGVDVVGLANNHQYDLLEDGVRATIDGFVDAGFAPGSTQFGLGATVDAAYIPAIALAGGLRIAFLGCTSIIGSEHAIGYVADPDQGGAAPCEEARVRDSVAAAAAASDMVVFSVHGGFEYGRDPSGQVELITSVARQAGAQLVINHHPHVVGGLDWDGRSLAAWSLGNLVFDQTVWPTFQSYVLAVHVRRGEIVRAYLEPVMIDDYVAHGIGTGSADYIARTAAGLSRGPFVVEDGAGELNLGDHMASQPVTTSLIGSATGRITEIGDGWLLDQADPALSEFGTDLLWIGDFDDDVLGADRGTLWTEGDDITVTRDEAAPERGNYYQLRRDAADADPLFGTTIHRLLLTNPGSVGLRRTRNQLSDDDPGATAPPPAGAALAEAQVSLTAILRVDPGAQVEVRLAWYSDTRGPSGSQTTQVITSSDTAWQQLRLDAAVPPDAVAVAILVRLSPPTPLSGQPAPPSQVTVGVDRVRLIEWSPRGTPPTRGTTHVRSFADGVASLSRVGGGVLAESAPPPLEEVPSR
ncbi:CapA family protein [Pseudonocardia broussonetiae]|nr:CapA family protein [Pseudonocardia broussonetiae]